MPHPIRHILQIVLTVSLTLTFPPFTFPDLSHLNAFQRCWHRQYSVIVQILMKLMAVFERPARHRPALRDSGPARRTAGGRYLPRNATGVSSGPHSQILTRDLLDSTYTESVKYLKRFFLEYVISHPPGFRARLVAVSELLTLDK